MSAHRTRFSGLGRRSTSDATHRHGVTLAEIVVVLTVIGIVLGYAALRMGDAADRAAVRAAGAEAITLFNAAREAAIMRRSPVSVMIDTGASRMHLDIDGVPSMVRDFGLQYGVRLASSRDSMAYDASGMGLGAANLSLVARRGRAVETVFVSRLGRARY